MNFLTGLFRNHVLANLTFLLVLVVGFLSYTMLPREQDPTVNFNWIEIHTPLPGASASEVEKRVTNILEEAVRKIPDIKFVSSHSREAISTILVRFNDISATTFDKRVSDLRREVQNKQRELPSDAEDPMIVEVTTSNSMPSATIVVSGLADDENLRWQAEQIKNDLERLRGVDQVWSSGLLEPELHVNFFPERLAGLGVSPVDLADSISRFFHDQSAGSVEVDGQSWLVRLIGTDSDPSYLARLPILTAEGEVTLGSVAEVQRGRTKATKRVTFNGQPAILFNLTKQAETNTLELVERLNAYVAERNVHASGTGVELHLVDDMTEVTRRALDIMQTNALLGLVMVLLVTWLFLGSRIAFFTCIGIPFILAGTFWALSSLGQTLNVMVLLGIVISLGMLVDDAVVVVEAIYYRMLRGANVLNASIDGLKEVFAPVTTAVLTTIAAFLPLMLMPGILGQFMYVVPLVVTVALLISLVEAYWILPTHIHASGLSFSKPSRFHAHRVRALHAIRLKYTRALIRVMRYPKSTIAGTVLLFIIAVMAAVSGAVKIDFFASDPVRKFYINVQMPTGTPLAVTLKKVQELEGTVRSFVGEDETRALVNYAGQLFTETGAFVGENYGQVLVSLKPRVEGMRTVDEVMDEMRESIMNTPGVERISFLRLAGGPPAAKPISIKVRGNEIVELRRAVVALKEILARQEHVHDIMDDDIRGLMELTLRVDLDAVRRANIDPFNVMRLIRLMVDGEVVASMQDQGEELEVRVRAKPRSLNAVDDVLRVKVPLAGGDEVALSELVHVERKRGTGNIRHYNFRRAITVEAEIDKKQTNTVEANNAILAAWSEVSENYPNVSLDFTGALDDINESIEALTVLFLFGIMLMYLILGTQFRSYVQPLLILVTVPMAFTGVVFGLLLTQNPLSLFTMYGIVALAGIAVNAAIVLISAANDRLRGGMSNHHAVIYAARRRVVPILITTATTVAGLFSLASGLGGHSLIWGPVATAIVWGLLISALLTLFVVPVLLRCYLAAVDGVERRFSQH